MILKLIRAQNLYLNKKINFTNDIIFIMFNKVIKNYELNKKNIEKDNDFLK